MSKQVTTAAKELLNRSPVAAAVVGGTFSPLWFNDAYLKKLKPFENIADLTGEILEAEGRDTDAFLFHKADFVLKARDPHSSDNFFLTKYPMAKNSQYIISVSTEDQWEACSGYGNDFFKQMCLKSPYPAVAFNFRTGRVVFTNKSFAHACGVPLEHIKNVFLPDIFTDGRSILEEYLAKNEPYKKRFILNAAKIDGDMVILEISPAEMEYKGEIFVLFKINDITNSVIEQVSDLTEGFFQYTFISKSISDGVVVTENNRIIDVNEAACLIWGYDKSEMTGMESSLLYKNRGRDAALADELKSVPFKGLRKDGSEFNGSKTSRIFYAQGRRVKITIAQDMTEHNALSVLKDGRKNFEQAILDSQPNLIFVYDKNNVLMRCNKPVLDFFGYSAFEDLITAIGDVSKIFIAKPGYLSENDGEEWFKLPLQYPKHEYKAILKDAKGEQKIFFVKSSVIKGDFSYVVSFSDITETVQSANVLKEANSLLVMKNDNVCSELEIKGALLVKQQKLAAMGEMIGIITHQWKQPLNTIGLISQNTEDMLEEDDEVNKEAIAEMMRSIMKHVLFMAETVDNFKDFFKNSDKMLDFRAARAVESTIQLLTPLLKKNKIEAKIEKLEDADSIYLYGYPNDFKQVIMNIIINAKDAIIAKISSGAAKPEEGRILISIGKKDEKTAEIAIKDNGSGLTEASLEKIFEMHYTTKGNEGSGIGMYMSKMIIDRMGGTIKAGNWEEGAAVTISLPVSGNEKSSNQITT